MDQKKIIHDLNTGLSSLLQSLELLDRERGDQKLLLDLLPLMLKRVDEMIKKSNELKKLFPQ